MAIKSHNKKRNTGLLYEQLIRYIARAMLENNDSVAKTATSVLQSHFSSGTELRKEFEVFDAFANAKNLSEHIASRAIESAKNVSQKIDNVKLRNEKAALIKEVNHKFGKDKIFSQRIPNYRFYATVQTLMNDWRTDTVTKRTLQYENKLLGHLKEELVLEAVEKTPDVNNLTVKLMTEKFNKKYSDTLSKEQSLLIREYVFSSSTGNFKQLHSLLEHIKTNTIESIKKYSKVCDNAVLNEKIQSVLAQINELKTDEISDGTLAKFMLATKLMNEMGNDNE
jgi:hypothetical protein